MQNLDPAVKERLLKQLTAEAWRKGELTYKLDATQRRIYDSLTRVTGRKFFVLCSRRLGKTYTLLLHAFEVARRKPGARVLFLAPTGKQSAEIATDTAAQILRDCPAPLRPEYKAQSKEFVFSHAGGDDSIVRLKGVNSEHADDIRGTAADLIILDECGLMDSLAFVVQSVCIPMTMSTDGRIILATTPAESPGHDSTQLYDDLAAQGCAVKYTLLDADQKRYPREIKAEFLREARERPDEIEDILDGRRRPRTTTALREYFCEFVTDANKAVIPEMLTHREAVAVHRARPEIFDAYVSCDPGFNDRSGILYAYYDFREGQVVVEDESLLHRASTNDIAHAILEREYALWADQKPYLRVLDSAGDGGKRLIADLYQRHGLVFSPAQKQDSLAGINLIRSMIVNGELVVDPRCVHLLRQMEVATWNTKATDFSRPGDVGTSDLGHFDLVAALKYLVRSVNRHRNPVPHRHRPGPGYVGGVFRSPRPRQGVRIGLTDDTPAGKRLGKRRT